MFGFLRALCVAVTNRAVMIPFCFKGNAASFLFTFQVIFKAWKKKNGWALKGSCFHTENCCLFFSEQWCWVTECVFERWSASDQEQAPRAPALLKLKRGAASVWFPRSCLENPVTPRECFPSCTSWSSSCNCLWKRQKKWWKIPVMVHSNWSCSGVLGKWEHCCLMGCALMQIHWKPSEDVGRTLTSLNETQMKV